MAQMKKRCAKCGVDKPLNDFHRRNTTCQQRQSWCKVCIREYRVQPKNKTRQRELDARPEIKTRQREYRAQSENKARQREYAARPEIKAQRRKSRQEERFAAFNRIGGARCVLCSCAELIFLAVDHADKNGAAHRKQVGGGNAMAKWILNATDIELRKWNLRTLCCNCNTATRITSDEEVQNTALRAAKQMIRYFKTIGRK